MNRKVKSLLAVIFAAGSLCAADAVQDNSASAPKQLAPVSDAKAEPQAPAVKDAKTDVPKEAPKADNLKPLEENAPAADAAKDAPAADAAKDPKAADGKDAKAAECDKKPKKKPVYRNSKLIPSLILTVDYEYPRHFAELACSQLNVPYLMIIDEVTEPDPNTRIVFYTPRSGNTPTLILAKDLAKFLAYLRPRDVILLGSEDILPKFFALAVPKSSKTILINSIDWDFNAMALSDTLRSDIFKKAYKRSADELQQKRQAVENAKKELKAAEEKAKRLEQELRRAQGQE